MSLSDYLSKSGISTYEKLLIVCERQFVLPPPRETFDATVGAPKSNPTEGVAVILPDPNEDDEPDDVEFPTQSVQKKKRRKMDVEEQPPAPEGSATGETVDV